MCIFEASFKLIYGFKALKLGTLYYLFYQDKGKIADFFH